MQKPANGGRSHIRVWTWLPLSDELPEEGYVTLEDASRYAGVSAETVRRMINSGQIRALKESETFGRQGWRWVLTVDEVTRLAQIKQEERDLAAV